MPIGEVMLGFGNDLMEFVGGGFVGFCDGESELEVEVVGMFFECCGLLLD